MTSNRSLKVQFIWNLGSQLYAQLSRIGVQILVLPSMLILWGDERYGIWLIITAIPSWLSMADLGFAQIAANEMTMLMSRRAIKEAIAVNQTAWLMNGAAAMLAMVAIGLLIMLVPVNEIFDIHSQFSSQVPLAIWLSTILTSLTILMGAMGAAMRAVGFYSLVSFINATFGILDGVGLLLAAYIGFEFVGAAILLVVSRVIILIVAGGWFYRRYPDFRPGVAMADTVLIKKMLLPSLSYISYSFSNALSIQGVNLIVGATLGPSHVVVITAIRTLTRVGRMASSAVNFSLEPIFAHMSGNDGREGSKRTFRLLILSTTIGLVVYVVFMLIFGESFLAWWTKGKVIGYSLLFQLMIFSVAFEILWFTLQTPFVSINKHSYFAIAYLILSLSSVSIMWLLIPYLGVAAAGANSLALHFSTLVATILIARKKKAI